MVLTQEQLIKQIAKREDINVAIVRNIFKCAESIIFDHLSSTTPSEPMIVKPLRGIHVKCKYVPQKEIHGFDELIVNDHIQAKSKITRYYNRKLNENYGI